MEFQIVKCTDSKVLAQLNESVQSLHHQLYPKDFKPFNLTEVRQAFETLLASQDVHAFVAKKSERPIGYLLCMVKSRSENEFQFSKTVLYLDQIAVNEPYRKQGVAQALLGQAKQLAQELKIAEIQVDHWMKNQTASSFFKAMGFDYSNGKMRFGP